MFNRYLLFISIFILVINILFVIAVDDYMALQGNVKQNGVNIASGNLTVVIFDAYSGGSIIYNSSSDFNNAISAGKYDVVLGNGSQNLSLEFGKVYYMEIYVNNEKFTFNGATRQIFQSMTGQVNGSYVNPRELNQTHLVLNIDLSNATNIRAYSVNKTTGTHLLSRVLDDIIDTIYSWNVSENNLFPRNLDFSLGIGTTSPTTRLDVRGAGNFSGTIFILNGTDITQLNGTLTITNMNSSWLSTYNATYQGINDTSNLQGLLNSTGIYSTFNSTYSGFNVTANVGALGFATSSQLNATYLNFTPRGNIDFNGGWTNLGVSIINGDLYAQTVFVYNITSLGVSNLNINGSLFAAGNGTFDNTFDIGNNTNRWRHLFISGNANVSQSLIVTHINASGNLYVAGNLANQWLYNQTNLNGWNLSGDNVVLRDTGDSVGIGTTSPTTRLDVRGAGNFSGTIFILNGTDITQLNGTLTITNMNSSWLSTYNATYQGINDTSNLQGLLNSTGIYSTFNSSYALGIRNDSSANLSSLLIGNYLKLNSTSSAIFEVTNLTTGRILFLINSSSGNVGIGTTTPANTLEVNSGADIVANFISANPNADIILNDTNEILRLRGRDGELQVLTNNGAQTVFATSAGSFGINTINPSAILEINSTSFGTAFRISNTTGAPYILVNGTTGDIQVGRSFNASNLLFVNGTRVLIKAGGTTTPLPNPFIVDVSTDAVGFNAITGLNISTVSAINTGVFSLYGLSVRVNHTSNGPFAGTPQIYGGRFTAGGAGGGVSYGVYGEAVSVGINNFGVYGNATGASNNYAGWFQGDVNVTGILAGVVDNIYVPATTSGNTACDNLDTMTGLRTKNVDWTCQDCVQVDGGFDDCTGNIEARWCGCLSGNN